MNSSQNFLFFFFYFFFYFFFSRHDISFLFNKSRIEEEEVVITFYFY